MITISEVVGDVIKKYPLIEEYISLGLINTSSFARIIKKEVEETAKKEVSVAAIVMAIKRMDICKMVDNMEIFLPKYVGEILVRSNLLELTYKKTDHILRKQKELFAEFEKMDDIFINVSIGNSEFSMQVTDKVVDIVEKIFKREELISKIEDVASITIRLNQDVTEIPGVYYSILKNLAWHKIPFLEAVSTFREFTIFFKEGDIDKAFLVLKSVTS